MKTIKSWLVALAAAAAALTSTQAVLAITYGQADEGRHPSVGAWMVRWPDGTRTNFASGTLIDKFTNPKGKATGIFLTAGHVTDDVQTSINDGFVTWDDVTINFNPEPWPLANLDIRVVSVHSYFIQRSDLGAWDDVGIAILEANSLEDLPEPAALPPVGFLDQFRQSDLHDSLLVAVGYGTSVSPPPPRVIFANTRNFSTPKYMNFDERVVRLQANGPAGNSGIGMGDSGGPLFCKDPQTGKETVIGINYAINGGNMRTFESGKWTVGSIDYSYRTDTQVVHDFIEAIIDGL